MIPYIIFLLCLTALFAGLKLLGHVNWSWVWVFSPLWVVLVVLVVMMASAPKTNVGKS